MRSAVLVTFCLAVAAGWLAGCERSAASGDEASSAASRPLLLLAAASTTDAVTELAELFQTQTGISVQISTAGSNALAAQILAGAPADLFLSANPRWSDAIQQQGFAADVRPLLTNQLVIVVPKHNPADVASPDDLLQDDVRRVALAGEKVPAGIYAAQVLEAAGVYETLQSTGRIARGQNVRLTLSYVEAGEAEAGIVYATDARASQRVQVVYTFPTAAHESIVYPAVLLEHAAENDAARQFYAFLFSSAAAAVFEKHGFAVINHGRET